jgi:hypothetical protein
MRRIVAGLVTAAFFAVVPTFVVASNKDIADQVVLRLQESGQMKDYSIRVTYKDGTARLQGRVASEEQMNIAVLVAMRTPNVTSVENERTRMATRYATGALCRLPTMPNSRKNPLEPGV